MPEKLVVMADVEGLLDCYYSKDVPSIAQVVGICTGDPYSIMEQLVAQAWLLA